MESKYESAALNISPRGVRSPAGTGVTNPGQGVAKFFNADAPIMRATTCSISVILPLTNFSRSPSRTGLPNSFTGPKKPTCPEPGSAAYTLNPVGPSDAPTHKRSEEHTSEIQSP